MTEVEYTNSHQRGTEYHRAIRFEINEIQFREITIDSNRIMAEARKWGHFELLHSFIGAAWMEKWRRFGLKVLIAGFVLVLVSLPMGALSPYTLMFGPGITILSLGVLLIVVWTFVKREALIVFTPGGQFKFEGPAAFIEEIWSEITRHQRQRDI